MGRGRSAGRSTLEPGATRALHLLKGAPIQDEKQIPNSCVQFTQPKESALPQGCQNPLFNYLHAFFHLGLIPRTTRTGRDDCNAIVLCPIQIGGIYIGLIAVYRPNRRLKIIWIMLPVGLCAGGPRQPRSDEAGRLTILVVGHITITATRANSGVPHLTAIRVSRGIPPKCPEVQELGGQLPLP